MAVEPEVTELVSLDELPEPAARETAVDSEGFTYDVRTGEVIGHAGATERFKVDSDEAADWVLQLRSGIEGSIAGVDARIRAVTEQLQALRMAHLRRLAWWEYRFAPELERYARSKLTGKGRTVQFGWGKVAFRKTLLSRQIIDMEAAVAYVEGVKPDAVAVKKTVNLAAVDAARRAWEQVTGEAEGTPGFLAVREPGESVTISTGVEIGTSGSKGEGK